MKFLPNAPAVAGKRQSVLNRMSERIRRVFHDGKTAAVCALVLGCAAFAPAESITRDMMADNVDLSMLTAQIAAPSSKRVN